VHFLQYFKCKVKDFFEGSGVQASNIEAPKIKAPKNKTQITKLVRLRRISTKDLSTKPVPTNDGKTKLVSASSRTGRLRPINSNMSNIKLQMLAMSGFRSQVL
jgi:hypothetical protein